MIRQNKTKLQFILGGALFLSFAVAACNNDGETKEVVKDSITTTIVTPPPVVTIDSNDTMEKMTGKKAPGSDPKPQ